MIKIGDFSQLSQVPVKTLRYYDEIGLLKPAQTDPFTSYRYYTVDQLPRLNRILALKELGLSLEQIAALLSDDLSPEQIRGMLRLKQTELRQHIHTEQERLARVETRLRYIEMEGKMTTIDAIIKHTDAMRVLSLREVVPDSTGISRLIGEAFGTAMSAGIRFAAAPFVMYYGQDAQVFDMEVVIPIDSTVQQDVPLPDSRRLSIGTIPALNVASTLHRGSYDRVGETYAALTQWISENGYAFVGPVREIYLTSPGDTPNPADYLTEVQFPVEKIAQPVR